MQLSELKSIVEAHPHTLPRFVLPDGDQIPPHYHVTEVGHLARKFIDCGGVTGQRETVLLQTHVGGDTEHRLTSDRFAKILKLGERVLPHDELDVEVEYDCCVVAQYPITEVRPMGEHLELILGQNQTQCLARERAKAKDTSGCSETAAACC